MSLPDINFFKGKEFSIVKFSKSKRTKYHIIDPNTYKVACIRYMDRDFDDVVEYDDHIDITTHNNLCESCKSALIDREIASIMKKEIEEHESNFNKVEDDDQMTFYKPPLMADEVQIIKDDNKIKELYALMETKGSISKREEAMEVIQKLIEFYDHPDVDELIEEHNNLQTLRNGFGLLKLREVSKGQFALPDPIYDHRTFRTNLKRNWSFNCGWCGKKVSSATEKDYYRINMRIFKVAENACSTTCADLIWKDLVKQWIHDNDYKKYFEMD